MIRTLAALLLVAAASPALADPYVVCDNGLRCVMAPCPSSNALNLRTKQVGRIGDVDLERVSPGERDRIANSSALYEGALVLDGTIRNRSVRERKTRNSVAVLIVRDVERRSSPQERRMCRSRR